MTMKRKLPPSDDTLDAIINPDKVRRDPIPEEDLDFQLPSPEPERRSRKRKKKKKHRTYQQEDFAPASPLFDAFGAMPGAPPVYQQVDPEELKLQRAVRKGKLFARITQLQGRGISPSKPLDWRLPEEEIQVELATMEEVGRRAKRVETGRGVFMFPIGAIEHGANWVDKQGWLGDFQFHMEGFSKHIIQNLDKFDDALERGVKEMTGDGDTERHWVAELLMVLVPMMVTYAASNQPKPDQIERLKKEVMQQLKNDPEIRRELAQDIAQEMQWGRPPAPPAPRSPPPTQPTRQGMQPPPTTSMPRTSRMSAPPPAVVKNHHPFGDYEINQAETERMQNDIRRAQELVAEMAAANQPPPVPRDSGRVVEVESEDTEEKGPKMTVTMESGKVVEV
jgi:hypothetical protein